jgi:hypothetical protein
LSDANRDTSTTNRFPLFWEAYSSDDFSEAIQTAFMSKISPQEVEPTLRRLIHEAERLEPSLASRLQEIYKWIKAKPPGLLMRKKVLLNFLTEIMVDADLWIGFCEMPSEEQEIERKNLSAVEQFWYFTLFPRWLNEPDPKLHKWKREILKDNCERDDEAQMGQLTSSIEYCGGQAYRKMILDFSMATDLMVSGSLEQTLCVQLTISASQNTEDKIRRWRETLNYWQIKRALFLSFNPCGQYRDSRKLAALLVNRSDTLPIHGCQETEFT